MEPQGQKQLLLLEIGAFPRQQLSLNELRRGILDELLLFGQPEIHKRRLFNSSGLIRLNSYETISQTS